MSIFHLALRWLRTRRVAIVAVLVMAAGVAAMITVVALWDGVERHTIRYFQGTEGDLRVRLVNPGHPPSHREAIEQFLSGRPEIRGVAPRMGGQGLVVAGRHEAGAPLDDAAVHGVELVGVDWNRERQVLGFDRFLDAVGAESSRYRLAAQGRARALDTDPMGRPGILLGDRLAEALKLEEEGAAPVVTVAVLREEGAGGDLEDRAHTTLEFHVAGVFSTGLADYDQTHAYLAIDTLRGLRYGAGRRGIDCDEGVVALTAAFDAEEVADALSRPAAAAGFRLQTWLDTGGAQIRSLQDQKRILVVILSFVTLAASAGICGMVYTMVREKLRDIGILRSMGLGRRRIVAAFTLYGACLGFLGCALGLALGLELTRSLDAIENQLSAWLGVELFDAEVYRLESMPTYLRTEAVTLILAMAFLMSVVASFLPAVRAGFLSPVRCLRDD